MGIMAGVEPVPDFADGTELSATLLNDLLANVEIGDIASRYGRVAFCSNYANGAEENGTNPVIVWSGGFSYVVGATTLTVVTNMTDQQSGDRLQVIRGGTAAGSYQDGTITEFVLANGIQTHTVTITDAGYVEDQIVEVRFALRNTTPGDRTWGRIEIRDAYISPIDVPGYPGLPLFGPISEPNLDLLSNVCGWMLRRIGQRVEPLFQAVVRRPGPWNGPIETQDTVRWTGSLPRTAGHPTIKALVVVQQKTPGTIETLRLRVNGATVQSQVIPSLPGEYGYTLSYDVSSIPVGSLMWLEIDLRKSFPAVKPLSDPDTSRISILGVWSEAAAGAGTFEPPLGIRSNSTFGPSGAPMTLQTWLNRLRNQIGDVVARLNANPEIWSRQPLYRARYAFDADQFKWFEPWGVAAQVRRVGYALLVRGKGVTVNWGPSVFEEKFSETGAQEFKNLRSETAVEGDEVDDARVYLDSLPALYGGQPFNVRGVDLLYAAEEFLVEVAS